MSHKPVSALKTIPLVWPFAVWGLDMVGLLRTGGSDFTKLLVVVDKFTKWIEAKPIKKLDSRTSVRRVQRLLCLSRHSVDYAYVAHPQSNGQAERGNGLILQGLKPRLMRDLEHAAGAWVTEQPSVLWGSRTTPNQSTDRTPFFMVYEAEAVLPSDLFHNAPRVELYSEAEAEQAG
ncbi:uncharacterized protein [Aegilops tauschii subsp. strangulata]|uniref:uncharacterized protein n=1 Tax=Aegilops tauschii subsp. strangulata TaxID=200361 RepID=UPI003CC877CA